ncbi:SusC/RagA family TonB-linked outer membrane protein [Dysgonomonas macrotermitis]|uniref:TonB-linked outer membrane protein, SusC/RagA family n=1 Tax=Dysgonomonas macrotermitis TaxID=1346286 RepID=A0A1M5JHD5_9BACT|nr:TonB-dependent receptor [Dysgonomonas macrotermitis]SHG39815.1 TonB-linked outer membrane protein, SusC/RagA family [Dysgonomonas macrotermitis]
MNYIKFKFIVLLCLMSVCASAQNIVIKGVVKDTNGEPIIGASVSQKGTTNGIISDIDGNFSLNVPRNAMLVVSYIGYVSQEILVNGQPSLTVVLEEDTKVLGDVVVIGYGTQRKEAVTGSVASIRGDDIRQIQTGNFSSALQGRVAGVEMQQTSSKPGSSMQIRIRGIRSLNASNDPLIVLDGIPFAGSISDINPSDIKSLDILKDASATAIYGSRGANGVMIITTHKGYKDQKAQVIYNGYYGIKIAKKYPMMNGEEFLALRKAANKFQTMHDETEDTSTDWQELLYQTGITTSHDINVTGGGKTNNYSFSTGYFNEQGVIPTQAYTRLSLRGSLDQEVGKYIKVGFVTNSTYNVTEGGQLGLYGSLSRSPLINPYNEDGTLKRVVSTQQDANAFVITKSVIEDLADHWLQQNKAFGSYNNIYGEVKAPWVEGLKYRINLGLNFRMGNNGAFTGQGVNNGLETNPSTASIGNSLTTSWVMENMLTYDRTFGKHSINAVGMYSAEQTTYNRSAVSARDIPAEYFQYYNLGHAAGEITVNPSNQDYQQYGLMSYMGRVMYGYDDRYMVSVTFRADGSSRLAKGHQWHTYPAVSLGWNLHEENFMEGFKWLDQAKLRVGYGETSNQAVDPYKTLGLLATRPYNFGNDDYATGYYVSELPNTNLGWEYSQTWNYGLDFSLLNRRIYGTFEYYVQNTKDVLLSVSLPGTAGVGSYMANIGATQNKGWELSLNGVIFENKNGWSWDAGINLYSNRNKLVSLASGAERDEANWWFVGHPIDVVYDYEKVGLWQESEEAARKIAEPDGNAGMIKVKYTGDYDANGLPTRAIGTQDRQIISMEPKWQGGFNTRVAYKDFDLSIVGAFKSGGILISTLYGNTSNFNNLTGRLGNVKVDYWTPENTGAKYPKPGGVGGDYAKYGSTLGRFDASYLKIRTITLGYNVPKSFTNKCGISNLRFYATVQNPFVFFSPYYDESGCDPEPNSYGNENQAMTNQLKSRLLVVGSNAPNTTNYMFGLNLTF